MGFRPVRAGPLRRWAGLAAVLMCLAGCQDSDVPKDLKPGEKRTVTFTITPETGIGDEASATHSGTVIDGIFFRHGAVLVKIGAHPPVSNAALQAAANTVLGRL